MNRAERRRANGSGPRRDVAILYVHPDTVDSQFFNSLVSLLFYDRDNGQRIDCTIGMESGPRIATARNGVVKSFLKTDCEWGLWFDADMVIPKDTAEQLLAVADPVDKPIVGALCFAGGRTKIVPTIYLIGRDNDGKIMSENMLRYPTPQVIEVDGTGSAGVLVHRSVFENIETMMAPQNNPLPWYQDVIIDGKDWGEDLVFCLRARAAGARIWVHTGVKLGHRKKWEIDEEAFVKYAAQLDAATGGAPHVLDATVEGDGLDALGIKIGGPAPNGRDDDDLLVVRNDFALPEGPP